MRGRNLSVRTSLFIKWVKVQSLHQLMLQATAAEKAEETRSAGEWCSTQLLLPGTDVQKKKKKHDLKGKDLFLSGFLFCVNFETLDKKRKNGQSEMFYTNGMTCLNVIRSQKKKRWKELKGKTSFYLHRFLLLSILEHSVKRKKKLRSEMFMLEGWHASNFFRSFYFQTKKRKEKKNW